MVRFFSAIFFLWWSFSLGAIEASRQDVAINENNAAETAASETIIMISHSGTQDPFWRRVKAGAELAAERMGVRVSYRAPETFDMRAMAQLIEAAVNARPIGLVVSIPDADALKPAIQKAVQSGVPVVSMNSGAGVARAMGALFHVGPNEYAAGVGVGRKLRGEHIQTLICVIHEMGSEALQARCDGLKDGFGGRVKVIPTDNHPQAVYDTVKAVLLGDPGIDGVVTLSAEQAAEPVLKLLSELEKSSMPFVTFDLSSRVLDAIKQKKILFAMDQQPLLQGFLPIVHLALYSRYQVLPGADVPTGPGYVDIHNAAQVRALSEQGLR